MLLYYWCAKPKWSSAKKKTAWLNGLGEKTAQKMMRQAFRKAPGW